MAEALPDYMTDALRDWDLADAADWATLLPRFRDSLVLANSRCNLTRLTEPDDYYVKHVLDSLLLLRALPDLRRMPLNLLDVGCGAGIPGLFIAMACPKARITEIDSVGKKIACVQGFIDEFALANTKAVQARAIELGHRKEHSGSYHVITARAVASTPKLVQECAKLLRRPGGRLVIFRTPHAVEEEHGQALLAAAAGQMRLRQSEVYTLPLGMGERQFLILEAT